MQSDITTYRKKNLIFYKQNNIIFTNVTSCPYYIKGIGKGQFLNDFTSWCFKHKL
jgi:hypothetical protein